MKNLALSAVGRKAREGFCRCGGSSGASSGGGSSSCSSGDDGYCRSFDLTADAAAKQASVNKLARVLGEEVRADDKVAFEHSATRRGRRNAIANIFCGLPSKGLRRLFAVYGIDEVQTKAPTEPIDLDEEARRERLRARQLREARRTSATAAKSSAAIGSSGCCHQSRARSAMDASRRRLLPAFAAPVGDVGARR